MNYQSLQRLVALVAVLLPLSVVHAGGLAAYPLKVEMSAKQRSSSVTLSNTSNQDKLLRIAFKEKQMQADGKLVTSELGRWAASPLVRFSPRQILVPAGSSQTVRLLYRRRQGMSDGEYRSHLAFHEIPLPGTVSRADKGGIALNVINGFSIPVYVNQGPVNAAIKPTSVAWKQGVEPILNVALAREGNAAAYGRLEVVSGTPERPRASLLTTHKFAIYKELQQRLLELKLPAGVSPGTPLFIKVWTIDGKETTPITLAVNR